MIAPGMYWLSSCVQPFFSPDGVADTTQIPPPETHRVEFVADTIKFLVDLVLATMAGVIGLYIHDQTRKSDDA